MWPGVSQFLCLLSLAVLVQCVVVDTRRCRKNQLDDGKGRKSCGQKGGKGGGGKGGGGKGPVRRDRKGKKKPAAPFWKKGAPSAEKTIVREGTKVTLTCAIKGTPTPEFTWLRNDKLLTPQTSKKIRVRRHRLTIQNVLIQDMGKYTCLADNKMGHLNFTFSLKILENIGFQSLEVVDRPENQTTHVGDTAIFLCRSQDWPRPRVHWTRRTQKSRIIEDVTASTRNADDSVLVLHNVTKSDSGVYTCFIGDNQMHKQLSATLTVIEEGEQLPFEPPCSLHVRRQVLVDHESGCRSEGHVEMHYCMGSCGRSYYIPQMMTEDSNHAFHLNQTCSCCVGLVESLRIVEMGCSLGIKKKAFYPLLRGCQCKECKIQADLPSSSPTTTTTVTSP